MVKAILLSTLFFSTLVVNAKSAVDILRQSDRARGGVEKGLTWISEVETHENGTVSKRKFKIRALDVDAHVEALEPARNRGEVYLFNDRTMWFFKPSLKKPVTISPRQKLTGQAANGDIASTNYYRDYNPKIEKKEVIGGKSVYVLFLKAKTKNLTYDQIRYWIEEKTNLAVKADFLTLQGRVFKTARMEYDNKLSIGNKKIDFVSRLIITDAKNPKNRSIIVYDAPKVESHSQQIFNVSSLRR